MQLSNQERYFIVVMMVAIVIGSGISLFRLWRPIRVEKAGEGVVQSDQDFLKESQFSEKESVILVHVAGAVQEEGVYVLPEGSRVLDAVEAAGGFCADSDGHRINLASFLQDGQQVMIPFLPKDEEGIAVSVTENVIDGKVRLNTATKEELESLPGVGPVLAERIIKYRQTHGPFQAKSDLLEVVGIGEKKFADIEDLIVLH